MPDVPDPDFAGNLWRIGSASTMLLTTWHMSESICRLLPFKPMLIRQKTKNSWFAIMSADVVICRTHLAASFWQINHIFETLRAAITRVKRAS